MVFDGWIGKNVRAKFAFERYADGIIIHTSSEAAAKFILKRITERFAQCGLELHPQKTKLVQTENRKTETVNKDYAQSFEYLGHQLRKKLVKVKGGEIKLLYATVVSPKARQRMLAQVKYAKLHRRTVRSPEIRPFEIREIL